MSYFRVDYRGSITFVKEDDFVKSISSESGNTLVVSDCSQKSKEMYNALLYTEIPKSYSRFNSIIKTEGAVFHILNGFDWWRYSGMVVEAAYIHRNADLNFLLQIMSRCRKRPPLWQTSNTKENILESSSQG